MAAVAAAIALVVVLTPGTNMDKTTRMAEESVMYSMSAEDNGAGDTEMAAAPEEEAGMMMDGVADEAASEESAEASEAPKCRSVRKHIQVRKSLYPHKAAAITSLLRCPKMLFLKA
jgi:hypothetical protein